MTIIRLLESWTEGLLRIVIGAGLAWIGTAEGGGYGLFLVLVGGIFVAAGVAEVWFVEAAAHQERRRARTIGSSLADCDIPVFYATTDGQARRIAARFAEAFVERGFSSRAIDVAAFSPGDVSWDRVRAVVVGASVHAQRHQRSARAFVRRWAAPLNARPSLFFSVSLTAAAEDGPEREEAVRIAEDFVSAAGWHPGRTFCVAGRLAYTQYRWLTRAVMKRIARQHGQPTDTTRDYEFTNWTEVVRAADDLARQVAAGHVHAA